MTDNFNDLSLHPQLLQAVEGLGYSQPTPIQTEIIPLMLSGADVIGQAQTGTGKTAAFALPILQLLNPDVNTVQGLVLAPTRELALQVSKAFEDFGRFRQARVLAVYGGQPYARQINMLKRGVDVVVGTPGRLLDLLDRKVLDISQVRFVVLDEADEMLSMGFIDDIEALLKMTPARRQTALFSATLPAAIRNLADRYLVQPQSVTIQRQQITVDTIEQRYYLVNEHEKMAALTRLFEIEPVTSALIFARTRLGSADLAGELSARGFPAEVLNGDLAQEAREQVLNRFRQRQIKVLVATDVAARGLDIDDISHVFNFDLPEDEELYVHRIGRTGRAGKTGIAISLVTPSEQFRLRRIESFARTRLQRASIPSEEDIVSNREQRLLDQMAVWLQRNRFKREREMVARLIEAGYDPVDIAAAALKVARADEKQRPISRVTEVIEPQRGLRSNRSNQSAFRRNPARGSRQNASQGVSHEAGMVRLSLNKGRKQGLRPNDVVSTIAYHAGIPGHSIGKIHIHDQHTLVDVPQEYLPQVLLKMNSYRIHKQPVLVEIAQPD